MDARDRELINALHGGFPVTAHPYAAVGKRLDMEEAEVIDWIQQLCERGVIRRFGLVLSHRDLGYRAYAMVV